MGYLILATLSVVANPQSDVELREWQSFVGQWRGVGQVRRGSSEGAWRVNSQWKWEFEADNHALVYGAEDGKYLKQARLQVTKSGLALTVVDGEKTIAFKRSEEALANQLVFVAPESLESGLARVSMRLVAKGDRLLISLDRRTRSGRFTRMGELGFTRQGSQFGQGTTFVECVVTGGKGTIPVKHKGETYYVCCTGCKDYFEQDPEKVLAEYRERRAEEAAERAEKQGQK